MAVSITLIAACANTSSVPGADGTTDAVAPAGDLAQDGSASFDLSVKPDGLADTIVQPALLGLWDPGFRRAIARSELGPIKTVTLGSCLYNDATACSVDACAPCQASDGDTSFTHSNFFSTVSPYPTAEYWVIDHNIDNGSFGGAFNNQCNSGPPNQSAPIAAGLSETDIFNFWFTPAASGGQRANLRLNNQNRSCAGGIPYLAIGANAQRGNGRNVGTFTRRSAITDDFAHNISLVSFRAALSTVSVGAPALLYFNVHARWAGKPRLLVFAVGHINHVGEEAHKHWNWPARESYFYNGYDIAYLRAETFGLPNLQVGVGHSYELSAASLLALASDRGLFDEPIPLNQLIAIEGVSWAIETSGDSQIGGWVENMQVVETSATAPVVHLGSAPTSTRTSITLAPSSTLFGTVLNLGSDNAQACLEVEGRPRHQLNGEGWCSDQDHWTSMTSSLDAGSWRYEDGAWTVAMAPVGNTFPAGTYHAYWRNTSTGARARGVFTVQGVSPTTVHYLQQDLYSKDGARAYTRLCDLGFAQWWDHCQDWAGPTAYTALGLPAGTPPTGGMNGIGEGGSFVYLQAGQQMLRQSLYRLDGKWAWSRQCPISMTTGVTWSQCTGWTGSSLTNVRGIGGEIYHGYTDYVTPFVADPGSGAVRQTLHQTFINPAGDTAWSRSCPISGATGVEWQGCSSFSTVDLDGIIKDPVGVVQSFGALAEYRFPQGTAVRHRQSVVTPDGLRGWTRDCKVDNDIVDWSDCSPAVPDWGFVDQQTLITGEPAGFGGYTCFVFATSHRLF